MTPLELQSAVAQYWSAKPCGSELSELGRSTRAYFEDIERQRYLHEPHILEMLDTVDWRERDVLEIGAGLGTDGRRIIERGARYTGINVDAGSTALARTALQLFGLPGHVAQGDATHLEFADRSFDVVYAFGVLMHIPQADRAMAQIKRVLRPGGEVLAMIYNRNSINYRLEIRLLRRLLRHLLTLPGAVDLLVMAGLPRTKLQRHAELARAQPDMSEAEWLSRNTDGPDNPYTTVYDAEQTSALFCGFHILRQELRFFDARHWGVLGRLLPRAVVDRLGRHWGWHRIVHARLSH